MSGLTSSIGFSLLITMFFFLVLAGLWALAGCQDPPLDGGQAMVRTLPPEEWGNSDDTVAFK